MQAEVPAIYLRREARGSRVSWEGRLLAAAGAGACLAVLIVAAMLKPNPAGVGTHREMGLEGCAFLARTGLPCPACGMTTSFAWFVRGDLLASLYVQPMGTVLAVCCGMSVWGGAYIAFTGRAVHRLLASLPPQYHVIPLLSIGVAAWVWKIFIHLHKMDGW